MCVSSYFPGLEGNDSFSSLSETLGEDCSAEIPSLMGSQPSVRAFAENVLILWESLSSCVARVPSVMR